MTKIAITGIGGFIGLRMAERALEMGWQVSGVDLSPEGVERARRVGADAHVGDIADADALAPVFAVMPWRKAMKLLGDGTAPFQGKFLRLSNHASDELDQAFFSYVYAHEKAIESFARKELAGEPESLNGLEGLLGKL